MKKFILEIVREKAPITAKNLALEAISRIGPTRFDDEFYNVTLNSLIYSGAITEIKCIIPTGRDGSFKTILVYLPRHSIVKVSENA